MKTGSFVVTNVGNADIDVATAFVDQGEEFDVVGYVPAGVTSILSATSRLTPERIGLDEQHDVTLSTTAGTHLCKPASVVFRSRGYSDAISVAASSKLRCVEGVDSNGHFSRCAGVNDFAISGYPSLPVGAVDGVFLKATSVFSGRVLGIAEDGFCGWYSGTSVGATRTICRFASGAYDVQVDAGDQGLYRMSVGPSAALCGEGQDSLIKCLGFNRFGALGLGSAGPAPLTTATTIMGLTTHSVASLSMSSRGGFVTLSGGTTLAAGTKSGFDLGTSLPPDGVVANPVAVDFNAVPGGGPGYYVSAFEGGGCGVAGSKKEIFCWDSTHPLTRRGNATGVQGVVAVGYDSFCTGVPPGVLACWNGVSFVNVPGAPFQQVIAQGDGRIYAIDSALRLRVIAPGADIEVVGFEGP